MDSTEKITESPEFFLELIAKGYKSLHEWRLKNPQREIETGIFTNYINFENFDFSKLNEIPEFKDLDFGNGAKFSGAIFGKHNPNFENAIFGNGTDFSRASASGNINFSTAEFGFDTVFSAASFENAIFLKSGFNGVYFDSCHFSNANFNRARFGGSSSFSHCSFDVAIFEDAIFRDFNRFFKCEFKKYANFRNTRNESSKTLPNFDGCHFERTLDLSLRNLETDLSRCIFNSAPKLLEAINLSMANFNDIEVNFKISNSENLAELERELLNIRAFRKLAEDTKNHDLERDIYIEERKIEQSLVVKSIRSRIFRHQGKWWERAFGTFSDISKFISTFAVSILSFLYWIFSNFGRSIIRPFIWFFISFLLFSFYNDNFVFKAIFENAPKSVGGDVLALVGNETYQKIANSTNLANNIPFVGQLAVDSEAKRVLFCGYIADKTHLCLPPVNYEIMLLFQNLFVGLMIFFFGLAIRNYFKIK